MTWHSACSAAPPDRPCTAGRSRERRRAGSSSASKRGSASRSSASARRRRRSQRARWAVATAPTCERDAGAAGGCGRPRRAAPRPCGRRTSSARPPSPRSRRGRARSPALRACRWRGSPGRRRGVATSGTAKRHAERARRSAAAPGRCRPAAPGARAAAPPAPRRAAPITPAPTTAMRSPRRGAASHKRVDRGLHVGGEHGALVRHGVGHGITAPAGTT